MHSTTHYFVHWKTETGPPLSSHRRANCWICVWQKSHSNLLWVALMSILLLVYVHHLFFLLFRLQSTRRNEHSVSDSVATVDLVRSFQYLSFLYIWNSLFTLSSFRPQRSVWWVDTTFDQISKSYRDWRCGSSILWFNIQHRDQWTQQSVLIREKQSASNGTNLSESHQRFVWWVVATQWSLKCIPNPFQWSTITSLH